MHHYIILLIYGYFLTPFSHSPATKAGPLAHELAVEHWHSLLHCMALCMYVLLILLKKETPFGKTRFIVFQSVEPFKCV